jgi:hypothetical protein
MCAVIRRLGCHCEGSARGLVDPEPWVWGLAFIQRGLERPTGLHPMRLADGGLKHYWKGRNRYASNGDFPDDGFSLLIMTLLDTQTTWQQGSEALDEERRNSAGFSTWLVAQCQTRSSTSSSDVLASCKKLDMCVGHCPPGFPLVGDSFCS